MFDRLFKMLDVEPEERGRVGHLLVISFLMGAFLATFTVASQTLFLNMFNEATDLPKAIALSGGFGILVTSIYNFLEGRIHFYWLAILNLIVIIFFAAFVEFGQRYVGDIKTLYYVGFTLVLPFTFVTTLVFWGSFARMFNLRQSKRVIGSVDVGMDIASIIAFFSIPVLLNFGVKPESLFTIALVCVIAFLLMFIRMGGRYLHTSQALHSEAEEHQKLSPLDFLKNKYIVQMSLFIIVSMVALRFIEYSFFNVTPKQFDTNDIPYFLSFFEGTIVIFSFLFTTFATDRINQDYGLRVSLIINPLLLLVFTGAAFAVGSVFGVDKAISGTSAIYFFIMVAMSKLFVNSLRDAIDSPTFKFYYVPIDKTIKIDTQTKIDGIVTAIASTVAGGLIVLLNQFTSFGLISISLFTIPLLGVWYWVTNRMYAGYRETLQGSLVKNKGTLEKDLVREYTIDSLLEKEVRGTAEDKVVYGLRLMEKLEPALFESSIIQLADSSLPKVRAFAAIKIQELGIGQEAGELRNLASEAAGSAEDSDLLSISPEKLMKLSKSVKQTDRLLAAKLLRRLISPKTIFILLELLRDADPRVRNEALLTARRVKRPETWNVLIDLLSSPVYAYPAASALKEAGPPALQILETAFHKSAQSDLVMLKVVQIMGHIGGPEALQLLWKKIDYPDKRIVKQILYSLRFINYRATGREILAVKDLLDSEMSKTLWNLVALEELPATPEFNLLKESIREEISENYDQISLLLSLLYDPQSVQLVRENIETGTPDGIQYGLELLDLFIDQDLKPKLVPLLDDIDTKDKLEQLQIYFPRENYNPVQVINYILNRDFNNNNRWTKVCAVYTSAYVSNFRVSRGLISQMFNHDKFLQEASAWVIYNKDKMAYQTVTERLPHKDKRYLDSSIKNNQLLDGLDDGFFLGVEMIMFIKQLSVFKGIPGNSICDLADKIVPIDLKAREKSVFGKGDENGPILIVAIGEVVLRNGNDEVVHLKKGNVYGDLFMDGVPPKVTDMVATERSVVFQITLPDFYFVLANHTDLVQGLIKNITAERKVMN